MSTIRDTLLKLMSEVTEETAKRLEKILAETPLQSALITAQSAEIERLKQDNERLQQALSHQHNMAGLMLREAERNGAERDGLKEDNKNLRESLARFQNISRTTDRALVCITNGVHPDIEAIQDGCIKIHLKQVLDLLHGERGYKAEETPLEAVKQQTEQIPAGHCLDPVAVKLIGDIRDVIQQQDCVNSSAIAIVAGLRNGSLKLPESVPQIQYWRQNASYWKRQHEEVAGTLQAKAKECREAQDDLTTTKKKLAEADRIIGQMDEAQGKISPKALVDSAPDFLGEVSPLHPLARVSMLVHRLVELAGERLEGARQLVEERDALKGEVESMRKRKDDAYTERNRVVAAFAKLATFMDWPVSVTRTAIPGWSEDWHGCVFIDTPVGQVSWHFHDSHADLFKHLPHRPATWDGHTTPQKYERLEALAAKNPPANQDPFHDLCIAACLEANRARGLYQKPDHLALALAEEAGEVTKAVLDHKQGKCDLAAVRKEIVQTMAMCLRLATEGDPTVDLKRSQE